MKGIYLGEFEEIVLLAAAALGVEAYVISIMEKIREETGRPVLISSVHTALYRLERKGFLKSSWGTAILERKRRRKRLYSITQAGYSTLQEATELRSKLWNSIAAPTKD